MIFVSVGTQPKDFSRFLLAVEEMIKVKCIKEEVIVQSGYTSFTSKLFTSFPFISDLEFREYMDQARVVITHAGSGSIFNALKKNKKIIVFPRLSVFKEIADDHQLELTKKLSKEGYVLDGSNSLIDAWSKLDSFKPSSYNFSSSLIPNLIKYIKNIK